jgi:hypothetical protein
MKRLILSFVLILLTKPLLIGQLLDPSESPPSVLIPYNNPTAPGSQDGFGNPDEAVDHNDDFTVQVRLAGTTPWQDLFEYKTYVNLEGALYPNGNFGESSFVNLDFQ